MMLYVITASLGLLPWELGVGAMKLWNSMIALVSFSFLITNLFADEEAEKATVIDFSVTASQIDYTLAHGDLSDETLCLMGFQTYTYESSDRIPHESLYAKMEPCLSSRDGVLAARIILKAQGIKYLKKLASADNWGDYHFEFYYYAEGNPYIVLFSYSGRVRDLVKAMKDDIVVLHEFKPISLDFDADTPSGPTFSAKVEGAKLTASKYSTNEPSTMWKQHRGEQGSIEGTITRIEYLENFAMCQRAWVVQTESGEEQCVETCFASGVDEHKVSHVFFDFLNMTKSDEDLDLTDEIDDKFEDSDDFERLTRGSHQPHISLEGTFPKDGVNLHRCLLDIGSYTLTPSSSTIDFKSRNI